MLNVFVRLGIYHLKVEPRFSAFALLTFGPVNQFVSGEACSPVHWRMSGSILGIYWIPVGPTAPPPARRQLKISPDTASCPLRTDCPGKQITPFENR